ncbi:hypothetical protein BAUCODRAFT_110185 [Baudoinia panamericana UAMH 10762]|uniref:Uncharacterized protein n=1 Tax=Baudoinia panamericana (strain UAMH 10762) TaxID=717646 RepID=M2MTZ8_BAUPA|nr:uncharacterized protein BAUCODRAFT_110185 [Baudoinia panamericana UAMH 10762]EMC95008.1 hypothetical protein BAUCODRAFT_110185 [Baudoinia panamericana UAMH 10762]
MNEPPPPEDATMRLAEMLKNPEDLDKLPSLRTEFTRKKAAVDGQLKLGLGAQLTTTQNGMSALTESSRLVASIKDEMAKIDRLCAEAATMIQDFPEVNKMSVMQRNFAAVEGMKGRIDTFAERLGEIQEWLGEDAQELDVQTNLLAVHEGLTGLREVRDEAMEQVGRATEGGEAESGVELMENLPLDGGPTLREYFVKLDEVVEWFDEHVRHVCESVIALVQAGNHGLVVRMAVVIEEEERKDRQVRAVREAQKEFGEVVASRFRSLNIYGQREVRDYLGKLWKSVEASAKVQFEGTADAFDQDPERLEKACRWFFNDLNTVKLGLVELVPKRWKIFRAYTNIYHNLMHDFLIRTLDNPSITPVHMLAILNWVPKYYDKMRRLGVNETELKPQLIDNRELDLVREYRGLITKAVEEWMERLSTADRKQFLARDESSLDQDADGRLHTKSLGDMWTMLREQLAVAQASGRTDVVEGVIDAMIRALKLRQKMWESLLDAEFRKIEEAAANITTTTGGGGGGELEGLSAYQDWLVAIANDQITCIDDDTTITSSPTTTATTTTSYLTRFKSDFTPLVSPSYPLTAAPDLEVLTNGYIDLASHCMSLFARLLFATDFRAVIRTFFVPPAWYGEQGMKAITTTFEDYLAGEGNVTQVLHPSLRDILVEELGDAALVAYLSSVRRNRGVRFRRGDNFTEKIKEDVVTVFNFFGNYPDTFDLVKDKWRAVNHFESLLSADKNAGGGYGAVVEAFVRTKQAYWDVQLAWVEAVLRARDDFDRGMLSAVKSAAASVEVERGGGETVMGRVK